MQEENNIKEMLEEIKDSAESLFGWDELKILGINKYGVEAVITTDKGIVKMSMRDLFTQYFFQLKVFETLGIYLEKQKTKIYEKWLTEWAKMIVDMGGESGSSLDLLEESLNTYIESAEDRDESYLKRGEPIIIGINLIAFKSNEFSVWLKKRKGIIYTNDQLHSALRDLNCKPAQIGKSRTRAWTYKVKEAKEETLFTDLEENKEIDF